MAGSITSANITTPIPPIQHVVMRQNCSPCGRSSTSLRIDAPVVVNPETLSNHAFIIENSPPHIRYGKVPTMLDTIHAPTTMQYPSLLVMWSLRGTKIMGKHPISSVSSDDIRSGK